MSRPPDEVLTRLGRSLREIDPSTLHPDPEEGPVRWFLGESGTEITAWVDEQGTPRHIQIVFARVSLEWTERGVVTGTFDPKGTTAGGRYDPYLLRVGAGVDEDVCRAAITLLEAASIDDAVKRPVLQALHQVVASV